MGHRSTIITICLALAFGLLIYAFIAGKTMVKISRHFIHVGGIHDQQRVSSAPARSDDVERINILGIPVPISVLIAGLLTIPAMLYANEFALWWRRRRRERLNQCVECGEPIRAFRGCCRRCGNRIGPDMQHVHTVRR